MSTLQAKYDLSRDVLFPKLLTRPENKRCFDCNKPNPKWCSWRFGVLICMDCAALHRQMGVHISQVKSCELDQWDFDQLCVYEASGGNKRAREFFSKHASFSVSGNSAGGSTAAALQDKYTCRAAEQYKKILAKEANQMIHSANASHEGAHTTAVDSTAAERPSDSSAGTSTTTTNNNNNTAATARSNNTPQTGLGAARTSTRRPASARRPGGGLGATRVKTGGRKGGLGGGLGAKKITQKVDSSLFEQAPEEPPTVVDPVAPEVRSLNKSDVGGGSAMQQQTSAGATSATTTSSGGIGAPVGNAFFEAAEEEERPKPINLRGTDGHVSLNKLMNSKQAGSGGPSKAKPNRLGMGRGMGNKRFNNPASNNNRNGNSASAASAEGAQIQSRFGDSKSISSKQYFGTSEADDFERRQRLSKFHGATSISSADYHGTSQGSDETDASELMGRLSVQAKMDMENMKNLASQAKNKLFNFARDMQSRYG